MLLVDTSIWIEVFRRESGFDLPSIAEVDEWVTCLPVIQEVLQGFRDEPAYRIARDALLAMPIVESPLDATVFLEAADLYRAARRSGKTVRSGADCLIAACAIRHDLEVLHHDRYFGVLAGVSALRARDPLARAALPWLIAWNYVVHPHGLVLPGSAWFHAGRDRQPFGAGTTRAVSPVMSIRGATASSQLLKAMREAAAPGTLLDPIEPALPGVDRSRANLARFAAELHRLGVLAHGREAKTKVTT